MAKKRTHRARKTTIPMAIVSGFAPTVVGVVNRISTPSAVGDYLKSGWTGIGSDGRFNPANLRQGLVPVLAGFGVHKVASVLGINRALGRARIPLVRV